ncbi:heterokaryon incompatibility protein-domain-containing protein [Phyllosticta capitalensis]|uniref:Heterokaryon incompatibility protein-domain-containing protein n=2 Tax=Phyllosticta capitalensis TaxID=121624 RepID=A0ABR1YNT4_9PEZI
MSTVSSSQFQHAELATASTIRLIKLREQKVDGTVACALRHLDVAEQPDFEYYALSYVWGNPAPTRHIYVEELQFPLHEALWQFMNWAWGQNMFDRWIWTDRICLNQEDDSEIAQQIPRMGRIFHDAKQVMAWLGMSQTKGDSFVKLLNRQSTNFDKERGMPEIQKQYSQQELSDVEAIVGHEYCKRVWILQEVLNAKSLVFLIGNIQVTLEELRTTCALLPNLGQNDYFLGKTPMERLHQATKTRGNWKLGRLLYFMNSGWFQCQRPNDRIYGCLGLVASRADGTSPIDFIKVDYGRSYPEVFLDALLEAHSPIDDCSSEPLDMILPGSRHPTAVHEPIFDLFKRYLGSSRTSERHKIFAGYVLQACDAFILIFLLSGCLPGCSQFVDPLNRLDVYSRTTFTPTFRESATILGYLIGTSSLLQTEASIFENWKVSRQPHISAQSPWRCAAHAARRSPKSMDEKNCHRAEAGTCLRGEAKALIQTLCLQPHNLARACGEYSLDAPHLCDASIMTLELLEGGFFAILRQLSKPEIPRQTGFIFEKAVRCSCRDVSCDESEAREESFFCELVFQFLDKETDLEGKGNNQHGN